jgi:hypothetical protein
MRNLLASLLIVFLPTPLITQTVRSKQPIVLTHIAVIGMRGLQPLETGMTVVIVGNRIDAIGRTGKIRVPKNLRVIDATGKYLVPGFWDMHVHLSFATELAMPALIANGVTGVRDMGGELDQIDEWRGQITSGELLGPRIVRAGLIVDGQKNDAPFRITVSNVAEARQAVISLKRRGVDFIKIHNAVAREAYFALADESRRQKIRFAGHIPKEITPVEASDAGQHSIEHTESLFDNILFTASRRGQNAKDALNQGFAAYTDDEAATVFQRFRQNGTWYDPVLVTYRSFAYRTDFAKKPDPRNRYVAASTKRIWDKHQPINRDVPAETIALRKSAYQRFLELIGLMRREEVNILAGTDAGGIRDIFPGFSLHDELELLVQAGFKPIEAIQAATINPAKFLGLEKSLGTIEKGKLADLVMLEANPLENISNTKEISAVIVNGRYLSNEMLQKMLADVESDANKK